MSARLLQLGVEPLKAVTNLAALAMTALVLGGFVTVQIESRQSREALERQARLLEAMAASTEALKGATVELSAVQLDIAKLQDRVTGFSDEALKARRAQGVEARTMKRLCAEGTVRGRACINLPSDAVIESWLR